MSSKDFNGRLRLVLGLPGSGKTSYALAQLPAHCVVVAPGPTNPSIEEFDYVEDDETGLSFIRDNPSHSLALFVTHGNPELFDAISKHTQRAILLDDISMFTDTPELKKAFISWLTGLRWRGINAWATTQRARAEVPPKVYTASREIYYVGPNLSQEEVQIIYGQRSVNLTYEDFYARINALQVYDWKRKNVRDSVFQIKNI